MDGIINVLKPPGMTSHDVVGYLRRLLGTKAIGHTGTLDPGVAGVLPICVGKATRVAEFLSNSGKAYRAEITLGVETDTLDGFGQILRESDLNIDYDQAVVMLESFRGKTTQVPPMVSAVKVGGKRLYELARQGKVVERPSREILIEKLVVVGCEWKRKHPTLLVDIECSKGTYIRVLCDDLGKKIGCGAHLSYLLRTRSGPFLLEDSLTLEELAEKIELGDKSFLLPLDHGISFIPAVHVAEHRVKAVLNGLSLLKRDYLPFQGTDYNEDNNGWVRLYGPLEDFLALGKLDESGVIKPKKVFDLSS